MKRLIFILLSLILLYSCNRKRDFHENVDKIMQLDSAVWDYTSLDEFTSLCVSRKRINHINICDSAHGKCMPGEIYYATVLNQFGIPTTVFDSISNKLCKIGFKTFYRYGSYSIWVEDGAFGHIYGYVINHNPNISKVKSFELDKKYNVGIGKEVRKNVYYFSSNLE